MEIEVNVAAETVSVVEPDMLPEVAVIVAEPEATAVARPFVPAALLTVALAVFDDAHVAEAVRF